MIISERIFYIMEQKNMSQLELSRRTGIATSNISDWKRKRRIQKQIICYPYVTYWILHRNSFWRVKELIRNIKMQIWIMKWPGRTLRYWSRFIVLEMISIKDWWRIWRHCRNWNKCMLPIWAGNMSTNMVWFRNRNWLTKL